MRLAHSMVWHYGMGTTGSSGFHHYSGHPDLNDIKDKLNPSSDILISAKEVEKF